MGLFSDSKHEQIKKQILEQVATINKNIREVATIMDNGGITINSITRLSSLLEDAASRKMNIVELYDDFTATQMQNFSVPWVDGRYMSLGMWDLSFCTALNTTVNEINNFCDRYK